MSGRSGPLSHRRLTLRVAAADVAAAEALLELTGAASVSLADAGDDPILEPAPYETPLWPDVEIRALFAPSTDLERVRALLERSCASAHAFAFGELDDDEWRTAAQRGIPARGFGKRLWLAPADDPRVPAGLVGIKLHMGLAFGTGEHPTTALCLEWLDAALERNNHRSRLRLRLGRARNRGARARREPRVGDR